MRVKKSRLIIVLASLLVLLTYSFPFSSYIRIAFVCGSALFLIASSMSRRLTPIKGYYFCFIMFCLWGTFSFTWASSSVGVNEQLFNMYVAIMINILMVQYITTQKESIEEMFTWLIPISLIFLVQSVIVGSFDSQMRFSPTGAVNQFGITTSYVYLLSLYGVKKNKGKRIVLFFTLILSLILTLFTGSRKALFNLVLFTCMILLFSKYDRNVFRNLGRVLLVIVLAVMAVIIVLRFDALYNILGNRLVSLFSYFSGDVQEDLSALRRDYMKEDAIALFKSHPILGIGLNNFKYVARYGTYAHSNYYELLCCLGIIGTLLYYIPLVFVSVRSFFQWKRNMKYAVIPFAIFLSFIINETSNVSYMYRSIHLFLGVAAGMVLLNDQESHNSLERQ